MKRTALTAFALAIVYALAYGQDAEKLFKVGSVAAEILNPIDQAISSIATNSPYLVSWNVVKTNLHWTTEGKQIVVSALNYAHNIQKTGPLATNLVYGANACLIHVGAAMELTWSGLGVKTSIAGHIGNRDILVSVQTWNPEAPETEQMIRQVVQTAVDALKKEQEMNSPNQQVEGIRR